MVKDLAHVFGNLATRVTSFAARNFDGHVPSDGRPADAERDLADEVADKISSIRAAHEKLEFRRAAAETTATVTLLSLVSAMAGLITAHRASRIDPILALRYE